jgi:hypothetical protein
MGVISKKLRLNQVPVMEILEQAPYTESLPTHRLSNMVNSNSDNIYSWVYRDELGSHGACRRKGCGEEFESTEHAMCMHMAVSGHKSGGGS